ncbi:ATP-binding cassette sub-family A member 2 [Ixodes scapularis]|uniref:ATP-binding cassette sub-family A member 2 n=1 Tax=Ixodes scapularis TaxID=6945 RepID=UPI001C395303|nr:ATP-binding cassette sub-family A member 2 [Ixodes scapularis]
MTDDIPADYNIAQYLLGIAQHSLRHYIFDIHAGFQMTKQKGTLLWYNGEGPHAGLLALSAFNTARLRNLTQNPTATMVFSVKAHPSVKRDENELVKQQNTYREVMPKVLRSIFFPMVSSLMCSNFVIYPVIERVTQVKHLHFMNGVSSLLYWSANFFWDFMFYLGTALFVLPPLLSQLNYLVGIDTPFLGCLGTVFVEHFAYTINAPLVMVVLEVMLQAMLLVPSFSYSRGMTKILELSSENKICRTGGVNLERVCHTHAIDFKLSLKLCCEVPKGQHPEDATIQALSVHPYSAFYEATTLAVEGLVLFLVLMFVESRWAFRVERLLSAPQENVRATATPKLIASPTKVMLEDSDAVRENALVDTLSGSVGRDARPLGPDQRPAMVVSRLTKAYGWWQKKPVLQGLSFVLRTGECFGLLGVNGAGKTTTFRILTGDVLPADGDVFLDGFSIVRQTRLVQAHLGYCPQRDGLVDELTGTETLILHSRLKGVANDADYLEVLFEIFDLADIAGNLVGTYSAGNKRKLSLCLAMVGMPRVLLLDEPYAGIGTTARKRVINYITALQRTAKMSIVLTSHSLTDVEFLCNRIAILGSGRLQCLGSLPHLKQKFGKGVTITVKTYPDKKQDFVYQKDVVTAVKMNFPKAQLAHSYEGLLEFRMTQVSMLWSEMFTLMGKIKRKFKLQDFFITDTSLEHIYRSFTRNETSMAAALAEVR